MEEETGKGTVFIENEVNNRPEEIFTKIVRAGKRTYFFDVKATRREEYYLTITESKKRIGKDGKFFYEKHKIFLYKEDFQKFCEGLNETVTFIDKNNQIHSETNELSDPITENPEKINAGEFTDIDFDDLGK